jgi:hypothetical protein
VQIVEPISSQGLVSRDQLAPLERRLGGHLPDDYVAFLLQHNGGRADSSTFEFEDGAGEKTRSRVVWFFGLADDDSYGFSANMDDYEDRIPSAFLPIGSDPFGNLLLLCVRPEDHGSVWFWDHEEETEEPDLSNMSRIAGAFGEFLGALR